MRLPPLNALKAFEAAARHGSFTRAANELHVSSGAISRQVKILEDHLGLTLFIRHPQGLSVTDEARSLLPKLSGAFESIASAVAEVRSPNSELKVTCSPTFANRWLVPRLPKFRDVMPEISLDLGTFKYDYDEFLTSDYDCAVATFHDPKWPNVLRVERVKNEELTPLCAPSMLKTKNTHRSFHDLNPKDFIHISTCQQDWPNWLKINHININLDTEKASVLDTGEMAIRAAAQGLGIVLMDRLLVQEELRAKLLVDMFPKTTPINNGYYFFCDRNRWNEPAISSFRQWLHTELKETEGIEHLTQCESKG